MPGFLLLRPISTHATRMLYVKDASEYRHKQKAETDHFDASTCQEMLDFKKTSR